MRHPVSRFFFLVVPLGKARGKQEQGVLFFDVAVHSNMAKKITVVLKQSLASYGIIIYKS